MIRPLHPEILAAYNASRTESPPVAEVRVRPNVSRLASLSRRSPGRSRGGGSQSARGSVHRILNLSTAVVAAGPDAWRLVAPALEGDRESLKRLRNLTRSGVERNRALKAGSRVESRPDFGRRVESIPNPPGLPDTPCKGTDDERSYLLTLINFTRLTSSVSEVFPTEMQVRISKRMTSRLGLLSHRGESYRITISQRLFRPGLEFILWDTVKHEMAHLADVVTRPCHRSSHGPRWQEWARRLGARPERLCSPEDARQIRSRARTRRSSHALAYPPEVAAWLGERRR